MVLRLSKLHQFFNGEARTFFLHTRMGVGRRVGIWKFQQKRWSSWFPVVNSKFHHFCPPPIEKLLEKSTSGPLEKSFRHPCTQAWKITQFV